MPRCHRRLGGRLRHTHRQPAANDQIDVWFTQHMVPYLRQTITVVS
jgi:hypothetical protein